MLETVLTDYIKVLKNGRMDEELGKEELYTLKAVRQILIQKFGKDPFSVGDPVEQLEKRMQKNGTSFSNYEHGNYEFCSSSGFLGPEDRLKKTSDETAASIRRASMLAWIGAVTIVIALA